MLSIKDGEGKHAPEFLHHGSALLGIKMQQNLSIA